LVIPFQFNSTNQMGGCKARKCIENKDKEMKKDSDGKKIDGSQWNDFKRCNKKVYKDGFCKICFGIDERGKHHSKRRPLTGWSWGALWKLDGIYGEPYNFPYHITKEQKKWVEGIYELHPEIRPPNECDLDELISTTLDEDDRRYEYEQRQIAVEKWLEKNSSKIDYKIGKELEEILRK